MNEANTPSRSCVLARTAATLLLGAWTLPALAQTAPAPVAQTKPQPSSEEAIQLDPFAVTVDHDDSYGALNSNSLTRFNTELSKMPVSADIYTQAFMSDVSATSVEQMVQTYSGGAGLSAVDAANVGAQQGDHVAHNYTKIRGFNTSAMQRDSLMPVGPLFNPGSTAPGITSNFDVERVEVIMGPQALLYSGGGPGGVINIDSKMARFDQDNAMVQYRIDNFGSKDAQADYNYGNDRVAFRLALLDDDDQTRRVGLSDNVKGEYGQLAIKLFKNTTVRLNMEQTLEHAFLAAPPPQIALSSVTGDSRASDVLSYLLATNQTGANTLNATTGAPNTAGAILNGTLNWGNIDSLGGWLGYETTKTTTEMANIQTKWTDSLSSELAFGYSASDYAFRSGPSTLYAPTNSTNPTGTWAIGYSPSETDEPAHTKALRFSVVHHAELFGGKADTQTIIGGDFVGSRAYSIAYSYWLADSNFNPVTVAPVFSADGTTSNSDGRTKMPTLYYPINNGIVTYPLFPLGATQLTYNGINYVRMPTNPRNPALVSPFNPFGLTAPSGLNEYNIVDNKGYFAENMTQWLDKKLTTLAGLRWNDGFDSLTYVPPLAYRVAHSSALDFNVGANYELLSWLSPYASVSNVTTLPSGEFPDPAGNLPKPGKGLGEEAGFKFHTLADSVSGSLALYHSHGTNELFSSATLENAIAPNGLNGRGNASTYFALDHTTNGVELDLTANPVRNWRMRLDMTYEVGKLTNSGTYAVLYNDQFYENSAGEVTYADKSVVYVSSTSAKAAPSATQLANYVPLTVAMMNNPASLYYANPTNPTGAISSSSAVATVLKTTDPVHGPILTGAVELPISDIQITPSFGVPSTVQAFAKGDASLGTPQFHTAFTNVYVVDHTWLKGLKLGGTLNASFRTVGFYYLASSFNTANPDRRAFYTPDTLTFDPILGYSHKIGKLTFETQLNVFNVFNHYHVVIIPSQTTGYSTVANLSASFFGQPRTFEWTNTVRF